MGRSGKGEVRGFIYRQIQRSADGCVSELRSVSVRPKVKAVSRSASHWLVQRGQCQPMHAYDVVGARVYYLHQSIEKYRHTETRASICVNVPGCSGRPSRNFDASKSNHDAPGVDHVSVAPTCRGRDGPVHGSSGKLHVRPLGFVPCTQTTATQRRSCSAA